MNIPTGELFNTGNEDRRVHDCTNNVYDHLRWESMTGKDIYGQEYDDEAEVIFAGSQSFLGVPQMGRDNSNKNEVDVGILGAPLDTATTGRPGTRYGPRAIRAAQMMPSPPIKHFNIETGVDPFETLSVADFGDATVSPGDTRRSQENIKSAVSSVAETGVCPFVLGGDHSITYANITGWAEANNYDSIGLIHFDCHADTEDTGVTGFEHDHGAHIKRLYDTGLLSGENYTLIGPRGYWPDSDVYTQMQEAGMKWVTAMEVSESDPIDIAETSLQRAKSGTDAI